MTTNSQRPLVGILMNCYNSEKYIEKAIQSVLAQSFENWELVVWDNCSEDETASIVNSFRDERIVYHRAEDHSLLGAARARAWQHVRGEFIAILDADDIWEPQKLEIQLPYFEDPEVGLVTSNTRFFNDKYSRILFDAAPPPTGYIYDSLALKFFVSLETLVLRRRTTELLGTVWDSDFNLIEDFDLVMRLAAISKVAYAPQVLSGWRVHEESLSWTSSIQFSTELLSWIGKQKIHHATFYEDHLRTFKLLKRQSLQMKSMYFLASRNRLQALRTLVSTFWFSPITILLLILCVIPFGSEIVRLRERRKLHLV